jgi:copper chaperone CopZ
MDCEACAVGIEKMLRKHDGVYSARVNYDTKEAVVQFDPQRISEGKIIEAIDATGFKVEPRP